MEKEFCLLFARWILFQQYSSTTTASVWDNVVQTISKWRDIPEFIFIRDFPDHPLFINFLAKGIDACIAKNGHPDCIILSYHGIPLRYAKTGDDSQFFGVPRAWFAGPGRYGFERRPKNAHSRNAELHHCRVCAQ